MAKKRRLLKSKPYEFPNKKQTMSHVKPMKKLIWHVTSDNNDRKDRLDMKSYPLTDHQHDALERIAEITGMDCWFLLNYTMNDKFEIFDLESDSDLSTPIDFRDGIELLNQGIDDINFLSSVQQIAYRQLLQDLGIPA